MSATAGRRRFSEPPLCVKWSRRTRAGCFLIEPASLLTLIFVQVIPNNSSNCLKRGPPRPDVHDGALADVEPIFFLIARDLGKNVGDDAARRSSRRRRVARGIERVLCDEVRDNTRDEAVASRVGASAALLCHRAVKSTIHAPVEIVEHLLRHWTGRASSRAKEPIPGLEPRDVFVGADLATDQIADQFALPIGITLPSICGEAQ